MKRVRYLAGVAGIAQIAAGALVAGAAPATAQAVSHGKAVSLRATLGHQDRIRPEITSSLFCNNNPLRVYWGDGWSSCWVNSGAMSPGFWDFNRIYTGNNRGQGLIYENGHYYNCFYSRKDTNYPATGCVSSRGGHPNDKGTLDWLYISP